jgi:hypothetical protein
MMWWIGDEGEVEKSGKIGKKRRSSPSVLTAF